MVDWTDEHPFAAIAREFWSAVADGDAPRLRAALHDDVVWNVPGRNPLSGKYRGPDGVLEYLARVGETADDLRSDLEGIYVGADGAVVLARVRARRGAKSLEQKALAILRIRSGAIVEGTTVPDDLYVSDAFWSG